ncbi:MAG TPA: hypothetical protein VK694_06760 [Verrucomicrobiae bacterium]|nr:hypothetical protein [Verrucomicrobiae bacterium]
MELLLNASIAEDSIQDAVPTIDNIVSGGLTNGSDKLYIVAGFRNPDGTGGILTTFAYGDRRGWKYPIDDIALGKFDISAATGLPSRLVQTQEPERLRDGDVKYGGSWVLGSIVVAASGFPSYWDEQICAIICHIMRGRVHVLRERLEKAAGEDVYLVRSRLAA